MPKIEACTVVVLPCVGAAPTSVWPWNTGESRTREALKLPGVLGNSHAPRLWQQPAFSDPEVNGDIAKAPPGQPEGQVNPVPWCQSLTATISLQFGPHPASVTGVTLATSMNSSLVARSRMPISSPGASPCNCE